MTIPFGELAWLVLAVIAAGVFTGILAGVFGVGGGGVVVPVLFEIFRILGVSDDVRMQLCIGTSLAVIGPTAWRSYRAHQARGMVIAGVIRMWALPTFAGVAVGAAIAGFAPGGVLKIAFMLIASIIAARLLFGGDPLALERRSAGADRDDRLWVPDRARVGIDGDERRLAGDDGADAARQDDP